LATRISDPGLCVRAGAALRVRQLGLLGDVMWFSGTLRKALGRAQRFSGIFSEEMEFVLQESRPEVTFAMRRLAPGPDLATSQEYGLAAALQISRELTSVELVPVEVTFTHETPANTAVHRAHFRCPLRFDAPAAMIVF